MELQYKQMFRVFYKRPLKNKLKRHLNIKVDSSVNKRRVL
jgi:hypothetical protein